MNKEFTGKYFGTEIDEKWWKRFKKNKMLARGNGTFTYDENSISFLRLLTNNPIVIDFEQIIALKLGKWHAGQWGAGKHIIKILWKKENQLLSSGFSISTENSRLREVLAELNDMLT